MPVDKELRGSERDGQRNKALRNSVQILAPGLSARSESRLPNVES